jgi:hypothetical protein
MLSGLHRGRLQSILGFELPRSGETMADEGWVQSPYRQAFPHNSQDVFRGIKSAAIGR